MKKVLRISAGLAAVVVVAALIARFFFPLQLYTFANHLKMLRAGVHPFYTDGVSGFVRDHCDPADPEARGCTCVALLHGLGDEPETWNQLLMAPRKAWAKPVRLYALRDLRTERYLEGDPAENYRVRNQASQIADALSGIKPTCNTWVIVGNSMGGWEAAWLALDGKLRIEKLILIDAVGTKSSIGAGDFFMNPTVESMKELTRRVYFRPKVFPADVWPSIVKSAVESRLTDIIQAQKEEDFLDGRLGTLRLPTMVLWGAEDKLVPDTVGKEVHSQIPNSGWREIPECGHVPQKECPLPVIQAINDMLRVGSM